jgi:hypothetical protein
MLQSDVRLRVLRVGEVEHRLSRADADRDRGDRLAQRPPRDRVPRAPAARARAQSATQAPVIARAARAAVGLEDVAVERDRPLAEPRSAATLRSERPMSRWISCVRPPCCPARSRDERVCVARGSMPYSAVIQPLPVSLRNGGTRSSTDAVHMTRVSPSEISAEPSAWRATPVSIETGRI